MHDTSDIYGYIITGNDRTGGLTQESRTLPNLDLDLDIICLLILLVLIILV